MAEFPTQEDIRRIKSKMSELISRGYYIKFIPLNHGFYNKEVFLIQIKEDLSFQSIEEILNTYLKQETNFIKILKDYLNEYQK